MSKINVLAYLLLTLLLSPLVLFAQSPADLAEWSSWVRERLPELDCPRGNDESAQDSKVCVWPGSLVLDVGKSSGTFAMGVTVFRSRSYVQLPGGATTWPLDTLANGEPVVVVRKSDRPYIRLDKGTYEIRGDFQWSSQPQFIPVPQDVALVQLGTAGNEARAVKVNERGEVWLLEKVHSEPTEQDSLQISVFRRLIDGSPFTVITQLQVEIAGRARDIAIGNPLLLDSTLVDIQSQLPVHHV